MSERQTNPETQPVDHASNPSKMTAAELLQVCMEGNGMPSTMPSNEAADPSAAAGMGAAGSAAGTPESHADSETDEGTADPVLPAAAEHPAAPAVGSTRERVVRSESRLLYGLGKLGGLGLTSMGGLLLVLPRVSAQMAETLAPLSGLRSQSGTLIVGGLCIFTVSVLMQALCRLRNSLDDVSLETVRLQGIAEDAAFSRSALDRVFVENRSLIREVVHLQGKLRRLLEIVSNPDYTASMFRLAASVDQLGKQVDVSMKGQFAQLQKQVVAIAQHAETAEKQLLAALAQIPVLIKEQHKLQQASLQNGFKGLQSAAETADARLDESLRAAARLESALQEQAAAMGVQLEQLAGGVQERSQDLAACLVELRTHVSQLIEEHQLAVHDEFHQLVDRMDVGLRTQSAGMERMGEAMKSGILSNIDELQGTLTRLQEANDRRERGLSTNLAEINARIDGDSSRTLEALEATRARLADQLSTTRGDLSAGIDLLATQLGDLERVRRAEADAQAAMLKELEQRAAARGAAGVESLSQDVAGVARRVEDLEAGLEQTAQQQREWAGLSVASADQNAQVLRAEMAQRMMDLAVQMEASLRAQAAVVQDAARESAHSAQQETRSVRNELTGRMAQLESLMEQASGAAQILAREASAAMEQASEAVRGEFSSRLARLEQRLESSAGEQRTLMHAFGTHAQHNVDALKEEWSRQLEQQAQRYEELLVQRSDELTKDMLEIAAIFSNITDDLMDCVTAPSPQGEAVLSELEGMLEGACGVAEDDVLLESACEEGLDEVPMHGEGQGVGQGEEAPGENPWDGDGELPPSDLPRNPGGPGGFGSGL